MTKGQNGRKSQRRLKPTVGCNASKRRRSLSAGTEHNIKCTKWPFFIFLVILH